MIGYTSRTGTRETLRQLRLHGWGLLVCASLRGGSEHRSEGFELTPAGIIIDNAAAKVAMAIGGLDAVPTDVIVAARALAWEAEYRDPFEALLSKYGDKARAVVAPDIVGGGARSLSRSAAWLPRLAHLDALALIPVQDGMTAKDVRPLLSSKVGIFVGGSRYWKWETLASTWGPLAAEVGCWLHVGRAASNRMVERCGLAGASSFDTTQPARYASSLPGLDNARRQTTLEWP